MQWDVLFAFLGWYSGCWPHCEGRAKHRGWLFYFKSQRNRSKLVVGLHIPLAMWAMFHSKRKQAVEMLSQATLSCFHATSGPLLSQPKAWIALPICSFKLIPPPPSWQFHILTFPSGLCLLFALSVSPESLRHKLVSQHSCEHAGKQDMLNQKTALRCVFLF